MAKQLTAAFLAFLMVFSSALPLFAKDYDEEYIYFECYTLYPDFVNNVKAFGATDNQILVFLKSVEKRLGTHEDELTEENFDSYMFDAIEYAFNLKKNIPVRDALAKAYPNALPDAMKAIVPEEYMPIYNTVKRVLFDIDTPALTLSGTRDSLSVNYLHMPDDAVILVGFYDTDGTLIHVHKNPDSSLSCSCESLAFAEAFALSRASLAPLCESFPMEF